MIVSHEPLMDLEVAVHWFDDERTFISDASEISDLLVDDWAPETYALIRTRAAEGPIEHYDASDGRRVVVGSKLEWWSDGAPWAWGEVEWLRADREIAVLQTDWDDPDRDSVFHCDVDDVEGAVYVDDWSAEVLELMRHRKVVNDGRA